jgi:hypothetical protein
MNWLGKILTIALASLISPVVTLFYRKGIWVTPDDPESPYGVGNASSNEPTMHWIYNNLGTFIGDWWWLGVRNRAYGLKYKFKPDFFKGLGTYDDLEKFRFKSGLVTYTEVEGYPEWVISFYFFHVIVGYRMSPVYDTIGKVRPINMDARAIFSVRAGGNDD